jgi:Flp pilus assembly protein TadD
LTPAGARHLQAASQLLLQRDSTRMLQALQHVLAESPGHPDALRLQAIALQLSGRNDEAIATIGKALAVRPDDAVLLNTLGGVLSEMGRGDAALAAFRRACELQPDLASAWCNLGMVLQSRGMIEEARSAFTRALDSEPRHALARTGLANTLKMLGQGAAAAAEYRTVLAADPANIQAWGGLGELKTTAFDDRECTMLLELHARTAGSDEDRATIGFALARALEDRSRYAEACAVLDQANAAMRRITPWDAPGFTRSIDAIAAAFETPPAAHPDPARGAEVIFVVSLPRSGSTLVEQVLAAHSRVEGAGELPVLANLVQAESQRRGEPFPAWVDRATARDWERLGEEYLAQAEPARRGRPVHVDKALFNWPLVGAIRAMLPAARIVNCRRDALETCWSIYRQRFARGQQAFAYDLASIAACWTDYDRLMFRWHARHPGKIHELAYERLVAEPEPTVRALLDYCGLPFEPACLRAHMAKRTVRTASAAQVREPLRDDTARAPRYGVLLDPLRRLLGE